MEHPKNLSISNYTYTLPEERIAAFPLPQRDASKLLVYHQQQISHHSFVQLPEWLPANSTLLFNNTRVIQARILFQKPTGGLIEIFCLEPFEHLNEYSLVMGATNAVKWKCMIGGASKWKSGPLTKELLINDKTVQLQATLVHQLPDAYVVQFSWQPGSRTFAEVLAAAGNIPLPPYIKRTPDKADSERYQTVYAKTDGSVAAPTAGLHFTDAVLQSLQQKGITTSFITLHVGAGTFKPVKAATMQAHEMHAEWIEVNAATIKALILQLGTPVIPVGTTSLRTLESLYWMGVKVALEPAILPSELTLHQWEVYEAPLANTQMSAAEALQALLYWMAQHQQEQLVAATQILIAPGYRFRIAAAIITNFHQPQSTLLLLVAAAVGEAWRNIYAFALQNEFRFLSYGDSSLLFIDEAALFKP